MQIQFATQNSEQAPGVVQFKRNGSGWRVGTVFSEGGEGQLTTDIRHGEQDLTESEAVQLIKATGCKSPFGLQGTIKGDFGDAMVRDGFRFRYMADVPEADASVEHTTIELLELGGGNSV